MQTSLQKISPAAFALALICFLLPWFNFSCGGQHVATLTGLQLVTGTTMQQPGGMYGQSRRQEIAAEPLAIIALLLTVTGVASGFFGRTKGARVPGIVGLASIVMLFLLMSKIQTDVSNHGQGVILLEYGAGLWIALLSLATATLINGYLQFGSKTQT
jgi:hypothetical protein